VRAARLMRREPAPNTCLGSEPPELRAHASARPRPPAGRQTSGRACGGAYRVDGKQALSWPSTTRGADAMTDHAERPSSAPAHGPVKIGDIERVRRDVDESDARVAHDEQTSAERRGESSVARRGAHKTQSRRADRRRRCCFGADASVSWPNRAAPASDEHRAHWPTRRRLLLRLGEARTRAPRCETIEARPEGERGASPGVASRSCCNFAGGSGPR
jgi:hypothetical protein